MPAGGRSAATPTVDSAMHHDPIHAARIQTRYRTAKFLINVRSAFFAPHQINGFGNFFNLFAPCLFSLIWINNPH
jgi:hypothetical protein